ncbi:MAG: glycosyl transferase [Candidatus Scalindua sp. AMX11]|nr:MAG: glycosyl transferase [Candidatus Scalindua sp.]NOG85841.1 glycosyl transferase [Planctomycetota bacterium]RZV96987.1 MAG: glycosyl transferase [Candidatus Scalindua sp. SCAELEC01]TDE66401.1 MAG: glycosyl transferase [Candidatus Scalindua sp. AMX11]GJQ58208.1 MAG: glycosyl transferase [Candidatus Scalindua sp.]
MGDFHQPGEITTLHRFGNTDLNKLEAAIKKLSRLRPIALVLPTIFSELEGTALPKILEELKEVKYLNQIIVTLGRFNKEQFKYAKKFFSVLPQEVKLIWNDSTRIKKLYKLLDDENVSAGKDGKGRSAWLAYGYVLAIEKPQVIVLHDCDIQTYSREFLARLCYPVVNHNLDFEFCKGYYLRVTDRMHGRVTRLFVTPLLRAFRTLLGDLDFLKYLDSFRYPLAGEFSMITDLARANRIPGDWGLEVGVLAEVYRNCSKKRICQVDLCETYEHKHQPLSEENVETGLMKMCIDISKTLFTTMASAGIIFSDGFFRTLRITYLRKAQIFIERYENDAAINGLFFDRHQEAKAVEAFTNGLKLAGEQFLENPIGTPLIPNWSRVISAIPEFFEMLIDAVEHDNK